jgi:hypothetical protein
VRADSVNTHNDRGVSTAPDWQAFNREYVDKARVAAIAECGGNVVYWNILLSLMGPFWTDHWNSFTMVEGTLCPSVVERSTYICYG